MRVPEVVDTPLRTAAALLILPAMIVVHSSVAIALALGGASIPTIHRVYVSYARLCLWVGGTRVEVRGREHADPARGYVVVSNHESAWDPPCLVGGLPDLLLRFVAKKAITDIPIFGHALKLTGNVTVVRTETRGDVARIREGMERRDPRISVFFFGEGTRSRDGSFRAFKMGAFATAINAGLPILPVAMAGTFAIWPKGTLRLRRRPVVIEVGEPISMDGVKFEDRSALRDRVHAQVGELRARARARLRALGYEPGGVD